MDWRRERVWLEILTFLEKSLLTFAGLVVFGILVFSDLSDFGGRLLVSIGALLLLISGGIVDLKKGFRHIVRRQLISLLASTVCLAIVSETHPIQPHEYLLSGLLFTSVYSATLIRFSHLMRLSLAIIAWGWAFTSTTSEIISHSNQRPEVIIELGDTVSMGPYFASFIKNTDEGIQVEYFNIVPKLYRAGCHIKLDDMLFRCKEDHYTSVEFMSDLEDFWTVVPFADEDEKMANTIWTNGTVGERAFTFLHKEHEARKAWSIACEVKNEIMAESADGQMIAIQATKLPLTIVILLGGLMFLISLMIRISKKLNTAQ